MSMFEQLSAQIADPTLCGRPAVPSNGGTVLGEVFCTASICLDFVATLKECDPKLYAQERPRLLKVIKQAMYEVKQHYDPTRRIFLENAGPNGVSMGSPGSKPACALSCPLVPLPSCPPSLILH
jgi:hypothetical protein